MFKIHCTCAKEWGGAHLQQVCRFSLQVRGDKEIGNEHTESKIQFGSMFLTPEQLVCLVSLKSVR